MQIGGIDDPALTAILGDAGHAALRDNIELLQGLMADFSIEAFLSGDVTPVFFGSALNNFGVEPFLKALHELAPPPGARKTVDGDPLPPDSEEFSGFIFKIQANMDPQHRDRMAFLRICSGRFEKDMTVFNPRLKKSVRVTRPHRLFAQERETVEEAYAGDVVGLVNPGVFAIGDTLTSGRDIRFEPIPRFEPECFAIIEVDSVSKSKQFQRGLEQLEEEGAVQTFYSLSGTRSSPYLAAVGMLQFEVVAARLRMEYGVETRIEETPFELARRIVGGYDASVRFPRGALVVQDRDENLIVLFTSAWEADYSEKQNPGLVLAPLG
jgi:peptide chain release factor 3